MYEVFFGLHERPFAAAPRTKDYFPAAAIEAARNTLARCIERAEGTGLVIGPAGTGKTLLCQVLAEQFKLRLEVAVLSSGRIVTRRALLQAILYELGLPYRGMEEGELRLALIDHLTPGETPFEGLLLLIDEAHTLPLRLLEEVRLITNIVRDGQPRVRLVMAGGPSLEERFANPKLEAFNQRLAARCYLSAFERQETEQFIKTQLRDSGGNPESIFADDAIDAVHRATDGIPRLVSQLCDHALVLAFAGGQRQIDKPGIEEAWADLQQLPTPWHPDRAEAVTADTGVIEFGGLDDEPPHEEPAAVPFRTFSGDVPQPVAKLAQIEDQLAALEDDFQPVGSIGPEVELSFPELAHPFQERFDEEEIIIDRYASLEAETMRHRPRVNSREGQELGQLLAQHVLPADRGVSVAEAPAQAEVWFDAPPQEALTTPPAPAVIAQPQQIAASQAGEHDADLIVIEDAPRAVRSRPVQAPGKVRRQEYRQLFKQLRRG
jgi:type II secretory pathway predicted ATPase ExeA